MQQASLGPGDISTLYECLRGALSVSIHQNAAEETLTSLGHRQGFCSCLAVRPWPVPKVRLPAGACLTSRLDAQEIIASKNVEHSVRWLATIHFKNSIARHWRLRPGQGCCCKTLSSWHAPGCRGSSWHHRPVPSPLPRFTCRGIEDEEKAHLRTKLLGLIEQEDTQVLRPATLHYQSLPCRDTDPPCSCT